MLNGSELRLFRERRNLSLRDVEAYCDITAQYIGQVETGTRAVTSEAHAEIIKGINAAHFAKCNGTFKRETAKQNKQDKQREDQ